MSNAVRPGRCAWWTVVGGCRHASSPPCRGRCECDTAYLEPQDENDLELGTVLALGSYDGARLSGGDVGGADEPGAKAERLPKADGAFQVFGVVFARDWLVCKTDLQVTPPAVAFLPRILLAYQASSFMCCSSGRLPAWDHVAPYKTLSIARRALR